VSVRAYSRSVCVTALSFLALMTLSPSSRNAVCSYRLKDLMA
jgi:hypothetical protein